MPDNDSPNADDPRPPGDGLQNFLAGLVLGRRDGDTEGRQQQQQQQQQQSTPANRRGRRGKRDRRGPSSSSALAGAAPIPRPGNVPDTPDRLPGTTRRSSASGASVAASASASAVHAVADVGQSVPDHNADADQPPSEQQQQQQQQQEPSDANPPAVVVNIQGAFHPDVDNISPDEFGRLVGRDLPGNSTSRGAIEDASRLRRYILIHRIGGPQIRQMAERILEDTGDFVDMRQFFPDMPGPHPTHTTHLHQPYNKVSTHVELSRMILALATGMYAEPTGSAGSNQWASDSDDDEPRPPRIEMSEEDQRRTRPRISAERQAAFEAERLDAWNRASILEARRQAEEEYRRDREYYSSAARADLQRRRYEERARLAHLTRLDALEMDRELHMLQVQRRQSDEALLAEGRAAVDSLLAARAAAEEERSAAAMAALQAAEAEQKRVEQKRRDMERSAEARRIAMAEEDEYFRKDRGFIQMAELQYQLDAIEEEEEVDDDDDEEESSTDMEVDKEVYHRPASVAFVPWDEADDLFEYYNDREDEHSESGSDERSIQPSDEEDEYEEDEHEDQDVSSIDTTDSFQVPDVDYRVQDLEPRKLKKHIFGGGIPPSSDTHQVDAEVPAEEVPVAAVPVLPTISIDPDNPPLCVVCDTQVGLHDLHCTGPSIQYECSEHAHRACITSDESTEEYRCPACNEQILRQCRGAIEAGRYRPCDELYPQANQDRPIGWECVRCAEDTELYVSDIVETAAESRSVALRAKELRRNDSYGIDGSTSWHLPKYSYIPTRTYMSTTLLDSLSHDDKVALGLELASVENAADSNADADSSDEGDETGEDEAAANADDDEESIDADDAECIEQTKAAVGNRQAVYGRATAQYERSFYGSGADAINLVTSTPRRPTIAEEAELETARNRQGDPVAPPTRLASDGSNYKLPDESSRHFTSDESAMFCDLAQSSEGLFSPHAWSRAIGTRSAAQVKEEADRRRAMQEEAQTFEDANGIVIKLDQHEAWDGSTKGAWDPKELDALRDCISNHPPPVTPKNKPILGISYYRVIRHKLQERNVRRNVQAIKHKLTRSAKWKYQQEEQKLYMTFKKDNIPRSKTEHNAMVVKLKAVGPFEKQEIHSAMRRAGSQNSLPANSSYTDKYMMRLNHHNFDEFMEVLNAGNPSFYYCDHGGVGGRTYRRWGPSLAHPRVTAQDLRNSRYNPVCACGRDWVKFVGNGYPPGIKLFRNGLTTKYTHLRENGDQPPII